MPEHCCNLKQEAHDTSAHCTVHAYTRDDMPHSLQSYDYAAAAAAAAAVRYEEEPFHLAALFKRGAFTLRYSGSGRSSAPDVSK
jgi:hypothetical protein